MEKRNIFLGVILILTGCVFVLNSTFNIVHLGISTLWPLIILSLGLIFEFSFFLYHRNPGILVPGGILTTIGFLFLFETFTDWRFSDITWPVYTLAVAIGLFQLYLFGNRNKGLLVPVFILTAVFTISSMSLFVGMLPAWINVSSIIGIFVIVAGLYVIFNRTSKA